MWAVFRYSTGRILCYFTEERSAQLYCDDQNRYDREGWRGIPLTQAPDWGYKLMTVKDSVDELCNGLDA
jgi:hypothetical protein